MAIYMWRDDWNNLLLNLNNNILDQSLEISQDNLSQDNQAIETPINNQINLWEINNNSWSWDILTI